MKLVLHNYWRSSASHRVRIALALKNLEYEYVPVNIAKDAQFTDQYKEKNPSSQVPTLQVIEDDGKSWWISQSLPIIEYLDERWPEQPILPRGNAFARARARAMAEVINSGIQPLQNLSTTKAVKQFGGDEVVWPKDFIARGLVAYERLVRDTAEALDQPVQFSIGDAPTIADCCLVPQLASARRFGVNYSQHELLVKIEERCLELTAFKKAAPEQQPDAIVSPAGKQ